MNTNVAINYSEYGTSTVAQDISFELADNILLKLVYDKENKSVSVSMLDMISDNTHLEGSLDYDKVNLLIKVLSQLSNQIKHNK